MEVRRLGLPGLRVAALIALTMSGLPKPAAAQSPADFFETRVRPVLAANCYACHARLQSGGLRLDSREALLRGGVSGPAIVPGDPEGSLPMRVVRHEIEGREMPRGGDALAARDVEGLVEWIRMGAPWPDPAPLATASAAGAELPDRTAPAAMPRREVTAEERGFWSFRPLAAPAVPEPARADWPRTDIDRFVLAKLEENGLTPLGFADRRQLIRRATFDLTGLPPTPAAIDAFVNDTAPDAFEKVVDRLLSSPHYGERWGRHWLDVARFGEDDTRGLAEDGSGRERYPSAYVQRDWVVEAFNRDMRYDLFVKAQLAGDLLAEPERTQALGGLGFLGGGPWYYDLANPPVARADERHDRVDVTTRGFLGLTVGCARCHDHKYDPIGTHDYYALAGIFNNTDYHEYLLGDDEKAEAYEKDKAFIEDMEESLDEYLGTESDQLARVLTMQASKYMLAAWRVTGKEKLPPDRAASEARVDLETLQRWVRFLGKEPRHYPYLADWQKMIARGDADEDEARKLADAFQRQLLEVVAEQDELEERNRRIIAKGTPLERSEVHADAERLRELLRPAPARARHHGARAPQPVHRRLPPGPRQHPRHVLSGARAVALSRVEPGAAARPRRRGSRGGHAGPHRGAGGGAAGTAVRDGVRDKEPEDLTDIRLHVRGSPTNLGEPVPRGFVAVLAGKEAGPFAEGSGRLQLAEAIASHPLAARVIVNRVWRWHMGSGIVDTPSNFGFAGERPTNPELPEYLAARFVDGGMSIKRLHRDIMLSATYRLRAGRDAGNEAIDGGNRYYWRANRRRLDAESIRDAMLQVSGGLDAKVGGPSLDLADEEHHRRTLYGSVSRFQLDDYLQTFDFPNPNLSAERRYSTNVPQQSLFFLNSPFVHRQAERLVRRLAKEAGGDDAGSDGEGADETGDEGRPGAAADDGSGDGTGATGAGVAGGKGIADGDDSADGEVTGGSGEDTPAHFPDPEMIRAAYPLLYGREVSAAELEAGLAFLAERRASADAADVDASASGPRTTAGGPGQVDSSQEDSSREASQEDGSSTENGLDDGAARRVSMQAWTQYARALFGAAEFRFID